MNSDTKGHKSWRLVNVYCPMLELFIQTSKCTKSLELKLNVEHFQYVQALNLALASDTDFQDGTEQAAHQPHPHRLGEGLHQVDRHLKLHLQ